MLTRVFLSLALLVAMPAWSQVPTPAGAGPGMLTPPPVSGDAYPTGVGSETRSNYLRAGLVVTTAYSDNVLGFVEGYPISDFVYSIWPTIQIDKTTSRLHLMLAYSPGFTGLPSKDPERTQPTRFAIGSDGIGLGTASANSRYRSHCRHAHQWGEYATSVPIQ